MILLAQDFAHLVGFKIIILTDRPWSMEWCTLMQLEKFSIPASVIYYMPEKDYRKAVEFKVEAIKRLLENYDIKGIYDDNEQVRRVIEQQFKIPVYPPFE